MRIRTTCTFCPDEAERIRRMAAERQNSKDTAGIRDGRMVADGIAAHEMGLAGEAFVAVLFGGALDASSRLGGDDGAPDVILPGGITVNVKTRSAPGYAYLLTPGHNTLGADYGVLVWQIAPMAYELGGIIAASDFDAVAEPMDYGHGRRIGVKPQHMRRIVRP
jgi:hypothetical protein